MQRIEDPRFKAFRRLMEGEPRPVEDSNEVFAAFKRSDEPILLVGGHAVNVWALSYCDPVVSNTAPREPLTSLVLERGELNGLIHL